MGLARCTLASTKHRNAFTQYDATQRYSWRDTAPQTTEPEDSTSIAGVRIVFKFKRQFFSVIVSATALCGGTVRVTVMPMPAHKAVYQNNQLQVQLQESTRVVTCGCA